MDTYVIGFVFTEDSRNVVLKTSSEPDARWRGIGGRVGSANSPEEAMSLHFLKATKIVVPLDRWHRAATVKDEENTYIIYRGMIRGFPTFTGATADIALCNADLLNFSEFSSDMRWMYATALMGEGSSEYVINVELVQDEAVTQTAGREGATS